MNKPSRDGPGGELGLHQRILLVSMRHHIRHDNVGCDEARRLSVLFQRRRASGRNGAGVAMTGALHVGAMAYANRLGWPVFPLLGKVPAIKGGRGCLDATTDVATVRNWWSCYPEANIGVATGKPSATWALDVDGAEGEDSLLELTRQHGPLPETVEQLTGGGGRHLLFRYRERIGNRAAIRRGVDVRSTGGYIVVAPSLHPATGRRYVWEVDHRPLEVPIAEAPNWLLDLVAKPVAPATAIAAPPWVETAIGVVAEGCRNDSATRVIGHLLRRWTEPTLAFALISAWNATHCRPPLPQDELAGVFNSVLARELRRREAA